VLGQQLPGNASTFTTSVALKDPDPGCRAGVVVLGTTSAWLGLAAEGGALVIRAGLSTASGEETRDLAPFDGADTLAVRIRCDDAGWCSLQFRIAGGQWSVGIEFRATAGQWISAELGLFAGAPPGSSGTAAAVFGPVTVVDD
jgi:hypothetical protein